MKTCLFCGGDIPPGRTGHNVKYCSLQCARNADKHKRIKTVSDRAYRHNAIALKLYAAYKWKCAICGWQATEETISYKGKIQYAHGNEIHHITPVHDGGGDEWQNVILLCPNHHKQADLGLINQETLRTYTRPYEMTEEEKLRAKASVAQVLADIIFN